MTTVGLPDTSIRHGKGTRIVPGRTIGLCLRIRRLGVRIPSGAPSGAPSQQLVAQFGQDASPSGGFHAAVSVRCSVNQALAVALDVSNCHRL